MAIKKGIKGTRTAATPAMKKNIKPVVKKASPKYDDRTGGMTGAPLPSWVKKPTKAKSAPAKSKPVDNYHTKAQKYITDAKKKGMTVKNEGSELIAYPKGMTPKPTTPKQTGMQMLKKAFGK